MPAQVLPGPYQTAEPHWAWVRIWQPAAAGQKVPVHAVEEVTFWHVVPLQQAPPETFVQGFGVQDWLGYQVLALGHWECGVLGVHTPVAGLQHAPDWSQAVQAWPSRNVD